VTADLIRGADRVYALSPAHLYQILQLDESAAPKARTLNDEGIVDPIGGNLETYRDCAAEIERCLKALLGV
jgi:protein-tyrosine-phosphatase